MIASYLLFKTIMESNELSVKKSMDVSKELEIINFKVLREEHEIPYLKRDFGSWVLNKLKMKKGGNNIEEFKLTNKTKNHKNKEKAQFRLFQEAMKILLVFGQCIGLNPVTTITAKDVTNIRFVMKSWIFMYSVIIAIFQAIKTSLCYYRMLTTSVTIKSLSFLSFYSCVWCTTFIFIRIGTKWSTLVKEIFNSNLDEYVDLKLIKKIKIICIITFCLAVLEHMLSIFVKLVLYMYECTSYDYGLYEQIIRQLYPWVFDLGVPFSIPLGMLLQVNSIIAVINWSYSNVFIVCMSLCLTSILNKINNKVILAADKNYLSPSVWGSLREDYTRATKLVRLFDEAISGLILVCFACNLFFISLQLFNLLANGIQGKQAVAQICSSLGSGPLRGYEYSLYLVYSLVFLLARSLTVALIAADVNVATMVPASALYRVPSFAFCKEAQRFLDQVQGDFVALSGLGFFYVTRALVLSVAGTIATYELVLVQINSDHFKNP